MAEKPTRQIDSSIDVQVCRGRECESISSHSITQLGISIHDRAWSNNGGGMTTEHDARYRIAITPYSIEVFKGDMGRDVNVLTIERSGYGS